MASERFVLCRRTINEIGKPVSFCGKPIKKKNAQNWCPNHLADLPIWPQSEEA